MPLHNHYKKPRKITFRKVYGRPWYPKPGEIKNTKGLAPRSSDTVHMIATEIATHTLCNRFIRDVRGLNLSTMKRGIFVTENKEFVNCLLCREKI
jgi:hypothetical protein